LSGLQHIGVDDSSHLLNLNVTQVQDNERETIIQVTTSSKGTEKGKRGVLIKYKSQTERNADQP